MSESYVGLIALFLLFLIVLTFFLSNRAESRRSMFHFYESQALRLAVMRYQVECMLNLPFASNRLDDFLEASWHLHTKACPAGEPFYKYLYLGPLPSHVKAMESILENLDKEMNGLVMIMRTAKSKKSQQVLN